MGDRNHKLQCGRVFEAQLVVTLLRQCGLHATHTISLE